MFQELRPDEASRREFLGASAAAAFAATAAGAMPAELEVLQEDGES